MGPGHRERDYHRALAAKLKQAGLSFEFEPDSPVTLEDGTVVGGNYPDLLVENTVVVELKARPDDRDQRRRSPGRRYFAATTECPVALFLNFGRQRLEHRRLLPPKTVQAYQRQQWHSTTAEPPSEQKRGPSAASFPGEMTHTERKANEQLEPSLSAYPLPSVASTPAKIDHIGIVVRDIQEALNAYETALGLPLREVAEVPDQKVEVAFLPLGESNIELVQPLTDDTGIAKYLDKRGEGIHHICIEVDDIETALARLKTYGVRLIDEAPRQGAHGRVAFVHPKAMHGVLIELVQHEMEETHV